MAVESRHSSVIGKIPGENGGAERNFEVFVSVLEEDRRDRCMAVLGRVKKHVFHPFARSISFPSAIF